MISGSTMYLLSLSDVSSEMNWDFLRVYPAFIVTPTKVVVALKKNAFSLIIQNIRRFGYLHFIFNTLFKKCALRVSHNKSEQWMINTHLFKAHGTIKCGLDLDKNIIILSYVVIDINVSAIDLITFIWMFISSNALLFEYLPPDRKHHAIYRIE